MSKKTHHVVARPGRRHGDPDVEIPVAEDLATEPGIPQMENDVSFYSRVHPLESQMVEKTADHEWERQVYSPEMAEYMRHHEGVTEPLVESALVSGGLEPKGTPEGRDLSREIRLKARELGYGEVGFTRFDRRYTYASKKSWVKYEHAVCLALEQDYAQTQTIPSMEAEYAHYGTYEVEGALGLELAEYIRTLGYHAQVHSPADDSSVVIPMFVEAGLGQLGANGQLLSPHFGSRARLMIITTDAPVTYDKPVDYGIHNFCQKCQVCVNRCPGRALVKEKVWWRGAEKNKVIYDRCCPVMVTYEGCGVCMKVCPIQRYGMKPVMEHYVETGEVLGKGTPNLEGYALEGKGYFGPGELPKFDREFFDFPHGTQEDWLFEQFKERLKTEGVPSQEEVTIFAQEVKLVLDKGAPKVGSE